MCHDGKRFNNLDTYCDTNGAIDGCDNNCNVVDGWYCTGGSTTQADSCYEICGDQFDFGTYACDDGDTESYDGCDSDCNIESGWDCYGGSEENSDTCYDVCNDGLHMPDN